MPCCNKGRLVADIGDIGTGETRRLLGEKIAVEIGVEFDVAQVHVEYLRPLLDVGQSDLYLPVETPRTHERLVENVGPVRGGKNDDARIGTETVHLRQELVERILAFVVAGEAGILAAGTSHGVYFVDEDDAGRLLLGLAEEVAHARCPHPDKHLHEIRTTHGKERHVGLTGHRLGKQRLTRSGRADEQRSLRYLSAEFAVLLRIAQEVHNLHDFHLRFLQSGHILESHTVLVVGIEHLRLRLAYIEDAPLTACGILRSIAHHDNEEDHQQDKGEETEHIEPDVVLRFIRKQHSLPVLLLGSVQVLPEGSHIAYIEDELRPATRNVLVFGPGGILLHCFAAEPDVGLLLVHHLDAFDISVGYHLLHGVPIGLHGRFAASQPRPPDDEQEQQPVYPHAVAHRPYLGAPAPAVLIVLVFGCHLYIYVLQY